MKKVLMCMQILINLIVLFFIPIVPGVIIGGMMSNGYVCRKNIYYTIFSVFIEKFSSFELADATYSFNNTILIIELIALIIINILFFIYYKKYNPNKRNLKNKVGGNNE